ncbi:hypothetical protein BGW38_009948, partial [Lunasporangiospora selenospora]
MDGDPLARSAKDRDTPSPTVQPPSPSAAPNTSTTATGHRTARFGERDRRTASHESQTINRPNTTTPPPFPKDSTPDTEDLDEPAGSIITNSDLPQVIEVMKDEDEQEL